MDKRLELRTILRDVLRRRATKDSMKIGMAKFDMEYEFARLGGCHTDWIEKTHGYIVKYLEELDD